MQAHGNKIFCGIESVRGFFLFDVAPVHEIEHPFRKCHKALYVHMWPGKAVVLGVWQHSKNKLEDHLIEALRGRIIGYQRNKTEQEIQEGETESRLVVQVDDPESVGFGRNRHGMVG